MCVIRNIFYRITNFFTHFSWNTNTICFFQKESDTAFSRLAVDTNNICLVFSSKIFWINWQIWYSPFVAVMCFTPQHTFCDSILMRTGEGSKYKLSCIWLSFIYMHSCYFFIYFYDVWQVCKV